MPALIRETRQAHRSSNAWVLILGVLVIATLSGFFAGPGSIAAKTQLALHGLCAQRPSHSLRLGVDTLPLDARMTGLYIGAATTAAWLFAVGKLRATNAPPIRVIALLTLFVAALGVDGFNALLTDLEAPHLYAPSNVLRLITGTLSGVALGVALTYLVGVSVWSRGGGAQCVVDRPAKLIAPAGIAAALGGLALSGLPILYAPFAVGLLLAAIFVFSVMGLVLLTLLTNRGWSYSTYRELGPLAVAAFVAGLSIIGGLAALRLAAERVLGLPQLT